MKLSKVCAGCQVVFGVWAVFAVAIRDSMDVFWFAIGCVGIITGIREIAEHVEKRRYDRSLSEGYDANKRR